MKRILGITALTLLIGLSACNKTKSTSNRFMDAGEWQITEMSVDGTNEEELPLWEIEDCNIYEESCYGHWENEEGGHADFIWQFREKANTFEISHQIVEHEEEAGEEEHDHASEEVAEQAYNFSGVYAVEKRKKDNMIFTSNETVGFPGQSVKIVIEKK